MYHRLKCHLERTRWYYLVTRLKWKLVSFRLEIVLILTQDRCTVCVEHTIGSEIGCTRWYTKVTWVMWNLVLVCLEMEGSELFVHEVNFGETDCSGRQGGATKSALP
jgi:hypothetical protein